MNNPIYVVTKVPPMGDRGNMCTAMGEVFLDPQAKGGRYDDELQPLGKALGNPLLEIYVQHPNFKLGEIIPLQGDRDQFTRKPSKWDIEVTECATWDEAVELAYSVCREAHEKTMAVK